MLDELIDEVDEVDEVDKRRAARVNRSEWLDAMREWEADRLDDMAGEQWTSA